MTPLSRTRTALALSALAVALLAAESAQANYTAKVRNGTLTLTGDAAGDALVLRLAQGTPGTLEADVGDDGTADFSFDRGTFVAIDVLAGRGDDAVRVDQQFGALHEEFLTIDGGSGADTLRGGSGAEKLVGGGGNDDVAGGDGDDDARLGSGADVYSWSPGDDDDSVEGDGGADRLDFNGSNAPEAFAAAANGQRVRFTRDVADVVMDLDEIERVNVRALGGADAAAVGDLSGTDLDLLDVDLQALGGGDGANDSVTAYGTAGADRPEITSPAGAVLVSGLAAQVHVSGGEIGDDVTVDGGAGEDVATYRGTSGDDQVAVLANGVEVSTVPGGAGRFDTFAVEDLVVAAGGGADTVTATGNLAALTRLTFDGEGGNDTLSGGNGADRLIGGSGTDHVDGQQGADTVTLGSGSDSAQWDPGDGSDIVDGEADSDTLVFNGSNAGEITEATANGERARFTRNIGNVVMDLGDVERIEHRTLGGADTAIVGDLTGSELETVDVGLDASAGGGDGEVDIVIARGTEAADMVRLGASDGRPAVLGLAALTRVAGGETDDRLVAQGLGGDDVVAGGTTTPGPVVTTAEGGDGHDTATYRGSAEADAIAMFSNGAEARTYSGAAAPFATITEELVADGQGGGDTISATGNLAALTRITMEGDGGNDTLIGGLAADELLGGSGNDSVDGNQGTDTAALGGGADTFQWDPGDGNDTVEGEGGTDVIAFNGSNASEIYDASADGERVRFTRNVANIVMDLGDVERIALRAFAGADDVTVGDLSGTDMDVVDVDLGASSGGGDSATDTVVVNGTEQPDVVRVNRAGDQVAVTGLAAQTRIAGSELLNDTLRVQTHGGDDAVLVSPAAEELITPVIDLGADG